MRVSVADCIQNVHARVSRNFIAKKKQCNFIIQIGNWREN